jgi:serine/threonine-protein kinase
MRESHSPVTLTRGTRIGEYEIVDRLGAGAMGEVYRARDVRLNRRVALKVLPERFSAIPDRLAAFEREARVLGSLNHPNIASLYDVVSVSGMPPVLVLELVDGVTLADRLVAEPNGLPLADVLAAARQVAAALEDAHAHGVVHRDLKPSNVVITEEGVVKLLDFGLAKNLDFGAAADVTDTAVLPGDLSRAAAAGTPAYMSPEQARGKRLDQRTDLWAFGCLVYEMLTGVRPFPGARASEVLASILEREPDFGLLPGDTPDSLKRLLRRCLEKRSDDRLRNAGDAILDIDEAARERMTLPTLPIMPHRRRMWRDVAVALTAGGVATLAMWAIWPTPVQAPLVAQWFTGEELARVNPDDADRFLAVARDGSAVAFPGNAGTQLFLRELDDVTLRPLTRRVIGVRAPFFSHDGQWIGYVEGNAALWKVARSGGNPTFIFSMDAPSRGASWAPDNTIIFATSHSATGLRRVSADGGEATVLTVPDPSQNEEDHIFPHVLPGGRAVLMTVLPLKGGAEAARIAVLDLETRSWRTVLEGASDARYVESGHLVYVSGGALRAVRFDLDRLRTDGLSQPVLPGAIVGHDLGTFLDVSVNGLLAYLDPARALAGRLLVWVDSDGNETILPLPPRPYAFPRISPDATRLAVYLRDPERDRDIALVDLANHRIQNLLLGPDVVSWPLWISGAHLAFSAMKSGDVPTLFQKTIDGRGAPRQVTPGDRTVIPTGLAPDRSHLLASVMATTGGNWWDVQAVPISLTSAAGTRLQEPRPLVGLDTQFHERSGVISPNGRFMAYDSDSVGDRFEVFVRPYPDTEAAVWRISDMGGQQPRWSADGRELFYLDLDGNMMAVAANPDAPECCKGPPHELFDGSDYVISGGGNATHQYDVGADRRFLMVKETGAVSGAINRIILKQNWLQELERLLPPR